MDNQIYSVDQLGRAFDELRKIKWGVDFSKYKAVIISTGVICTIKHRHGHIFVQYQHYFPMFLDRKLNPGQAH